MSLLLVFSGRVAAEDCGPSISVDSPAQPLAKTLGELRHRIRMRVWFELNIKPNDILAPRLKGDYTLCELLDRSLAGKPYSFREKWRGFEIYRVAPIKPGKPDKPGSSRVSALDEIRVIGGRKRTRDGALPITELDSESLKGPSAINLAFALRDKLSPNSLKAVTDPTADVFGIGASLNLRGMGANQTLVLINGHRIAAESVGGDKLQPDLTTMGPSQIDRVMVLPTSGSGMYGGGATAGVIDVITRREAHGIELEGNSERFADGGRDSERLSVTTGTSLADDRLQLGLSTTFARLAPILTGDRSFAASNRERIERHNPGYFVSAGVVPLGAATNILALDGHLFGPDSPANTFVSSGSAGDDLAGLMRNAGRFNMELADSAQLQGGSRYAMRSESSFQSALGWANYNSGPLAVNLDIGASHRTREFGLSGADYSPVRNVEIPASANRLRKALRVTIPVSAGDGLMRTDVRARRAILAGTYQFSSDWLARASHAWSDSSLLLDRPMFELDPRILTEGRVDVFADPVPDLAAWGQRSRLHISTLRSVVEETTLGLAKSVVDLPAGAMMLDLRVDHRRERSGAGGAEEVQELERDGGRLVRSIYPEQVQRIDGAAAELVIPILANAEPNMLEEKDDPNVRLLAQLSVRGDRYNTLSASDYEPGDSASYSRSSFGSFNYSAAVRFDPMPGLRLRSSYSTGFLPPFPAQLSAATTRILPAGELLDRARGGEPSGPIVLRMGGNPDLNPERSYGYSAGFVVRSRAAGDMRLSVDFVRIVKTDVASTPSDMLVDSPADFPLEFPDSISRGPVSAGDAFSVGPITAIDVTSRNVLRAEINAWDVSYDHSFYAGETAKVRLSLLGTYQPRFATQSSRGSALKNHAGVTSESPLRYHASGGVTLELPHWDFGWQLRYLPRYVVSEDPVVQQNQGGRYVSNHQYHDLFARRIFSLAGSGGGSVEVEFGVRNVGNQKPSFDAGAPMSDYRSPFGSPQLVTGYVSVKTAF